jgi:hypothetical protein
MMQLWTAPVQSYPMVMNILLLRAVAIFLGSEILSIGMPAKAGPGVSPSAS